MQSDGGATPTPVQIRVLRRVESVEEDGSDAAIGRIGAAGVEDQSRVDFRLVRVSSPHVICVNGSLVGSAWTAEAAPKNVFFASA